MFVDFCRVSKNDKDTPNYDYRFIVERIRDLIDTTDHYRKESQLKGRFTTLAIVNRGSNNSAH